MARVRNGHLSRADPRDGGVQLVEGLISDPRVDLGGQANATPALVNHNRAMGSLHGVEHRRIIEGAQGAQVDDICLDAFGGELLGGVEGGAERATVSDDGDVVTVMTYRSSLGSGSSSAVASMPRASASVAGATTRIPGMWAYHASRLCECCAASCRPAPVVILMTSGTLHWPPDMCSSAAALFTI